MRNLLSVCLLLAACGDNQATNRVDAAVAPDTQRPIDAADPRGPRAIALAGPANGLLWDAASSTLYFTDNTADALLRYTDAGGVETVAALPAATMGISLGDIVKRSDGTILVASFGFGTQGTLFSVPPGGAAVALGGFNGMRRRIGLAQAPDGTLYSTYFVGGGGGMPNGGVGEVAITGATAAETEIAGMDDGLKKLVGMAATADAVFVADQTQNKIFKVARPGNAVTLVADVPSADMMTLLPNGDLLTTGTAVHRVTQAGVVTTLPGTYASVRGVAYDPALERLFLIEHSTAPGSADQLHVVPFEL